MLRFLLTLLCVLFLGQALALAAVPVAQECAVTCADDTPEGSCEPSCSDCGCCTHGAQPLLAPQGLAPCALPAARDRAIAACSQAPAGSPADVFHVPRSLLA